MRLRHALGAAFAIAVTLTPAALAADTAAPPQVSGVSKVDGHTVRVIVRAPGDLTGLDVQAELGGKTAQVTRLRPLGPRRPLHLVFAVDTSTSMAGPPLAAAVAAGQRLLDAVGSTDKVGLVEFDGSARTVTPLTGNVQAVQAALSTLTTHSGTALYDGIGDAARLTGPSDGSRRVVVVLSDGDDTTSTTSLDHLTAALARDGVEVDAVGLTSSGSYTATALRQVAAATHGAYVPAARSPRSSRSRPGWPRRGWPASGPSTWRCPTPARGRSRSACTGGRRRRWRCRAAWPGRRCLCGASTGRGSWHCSGSPPS